MGRLTDRFPERALDPLARTRSYLERRRGAPDPLRQARQDRSLRRAAHAVFPRDLTVATGTTAWNPGNLATNAEEGVAVTVPGVRNDGSWVCSGSFTQLASSGKWMISAHPTGDDTALIRIENKTATSVDLGSGTVRIICWGV